MLRIAAIILVVLLGQTALAGGTVTVKSALSNEDFYKAVTCAAPPGKPCPEKAVRWPKGKAKRLTVALDFPEGFSDRDKARFVAALSNGIRTINDAGAAVVLSRVADGKRADIIVSVVDPNAMTMLNQLTGASDPQRFISHIVLNQSGTTIRGAQITVAQHIRAADINSNIAGNLLKALGLFNNVKGGPYGSASLLTGTANRQTKVVGQDLNALRMHYPG